MSFLSGMFLIALVAAAGPTIIHLLNRRRRQTIYWGPMDFLREVIKRSRRILRLRDMLLLVLRTIIVILFVLAMSRPYWSAGADAGAGNRPMHAVLVIDNSLSMGYAQLDKSLLAEAKDKTREFIESLPDGSEVSVIPLCSYSRWQARDVYSTREDAVEAVNRIKVVDRSAPITVGFAQARKACRLASDLPTKRVVFVGDAQRRTWSLDGAETYLEGITDIQIVTVGPAERTNTWVSDFKLLHGIADTDSTAVFRATIRHEGKPREGVRVALLIDDAVATERYVDLVPGHELRLDFLHKFNVAGTSAEPLFVPATLKLSPDRLELDDYRMMIVPIVARTPVVFIDQHGRNERPRENVFGETSRVRRLLRSAARRGPGQKQLVKQVLRTIEEVTIDDLKEARLVVIGGVRSPTPKAVEMLREYVEQGGNIFIGTGETFDPVLWTATAWLDGAGILPAPLQDVPVGRMPEPNQTTLVSFRLDKPSIMGRALYLDTTSEEINEILDVPRFYKAVVADIDAATKAISQFERKRIEQQRKWMLQNNANEKRWAEQERAGNLSAEDTERRRNDRIAAAGRSPNWLAWKNPLARDTSEFLVDDLVGATQPRVLGRYDNGHPFVVQREIGKGRVVMMTSGLWPVWNTMALDKSVLLLDRIVRSLLVRSLPDRTFGPESEIVVPVTAADQAADFAVQAPGSSEKHLQSVEALGSQSYGLVLRAVHQRGVYRIQRGAAGGEDTDRRKDDAWNMVLAVNGPAEESELDPRAEADIPDRIGETNITCIGPDEKISLVGKTYVGHDFWWILMLLVLACLLLEMVLLAGWRLAWLPRSARTPQDSTDQTAAPEKTQ